MAKDNSSNLSAEVSQAKKKLNRNQIIDKIFVPIRGSPSNFILGPCFKTKFPLELSHVYPLAEGEKLLVHSAEADWSGAKTLRSWPTVSKTWTDWVDRVEKAKGEVWKSADIYDAIQLSKISIHVDINLLYAALRFWSICSNSFHFRVGMMGPTLLDIVALTGLRPHGVEVSSILRKSGDFTEYENIKECLTLDASMPVTEEEHISFLVVWLCKYLFCNTSINMIKQCTKLAFALGSGRKLALAPFVLSNLYHGCNDIIMGKFDDAMGPFWILQFWLQSYFPEFRPLTSDKCNAPTYGFPLAKASLRPQTFSEYFLFFHKCSSRTAGQFTPFSSGKFGPEWFKRSLDPYFQKLNRTEVKEIWASYLIARDLPYSILSDESSEFKRAFEHYSPNQFARQFGMTQGVPLHQSLSITRENVQSAHYSEGTESRIFQLNTKFMFVYFNTNPSSTQLFDSWWSDYINNQDKTAGKFDQNMKRKYTGYSIPSQSFVQKDESEAGELVYARRTLSKKMKTFPMKIAVPGTTSTGPSASAYDPPNEDRSKADVQISADETPISASSSDIDVEKYADSPSLTKTRSNTSDVSEPPDDNPVKFDNVEDFFARVSGQIKRAQSVSLPTDQSSSVNVKDEIERLLMMPSHELLLPENSSKLSAALLVYAESPDLSVERALSLAKLKENLPYLSSTLSRAKKEQEEYYKKAAKKVLLVDELIKVQEVYTNLKDLNDKLECKLDSIRCQLIKLNESLKDAKTKIKAIQEQKMSLAKKCFEKSNALDEMEAEFRVLEKMKELAEADIARVEESLRDLKSSITESPT